MPKLEVKYCLSLFMRVRLPTSFSLNLITHFLRAAVINPTHSGNDNRASKTQIQADINSCSYSGSWLLSVPEIRITLPQLLASTVLKCCCLQLLPFMMTDREWHLWNSYFLTWCCIIYMLTVGISIFFPLTYITAGLCRTVSLGIFVTAPMLLTKWKRQE